MWLLSDPESEYNKRKHEINDRIVDQSLQILKSEHESSLKKSNYMHLKTEWKQEQYIESTEYADTICLLKFRTDNHRLPVETGRYQNVEFKDRLCHECKMEVGDKFHYLFSCPLFKAEREELIPPKYRNRPNVYKYKALLGHTDIKILRKLCRFIKIITKSIN